MTARSNEIYSLMPRYTNLPKTRGWCRTVRIWRTHNIPKAPFSFERYVTRDTWLGCFTWEIHDSTSWWGPFVLGGTSMHGLETFFALQLFNIVTARRRGRNADPFHATVYRRLSCGSWPWRRECLVSWDARCEYCEPSGVLVIASASYEKQPTSVV